MNTRANVEISTLSMEDLEAACGGGGTPITLSSNNTVSVPHVKVRDLMTPQMVESLLSIFSGFNPPVRNG